MAAIIQEIFRSAFARMNLDQLLVHHLMCFTKVSTKPALPFMKRNHDYLQSHKSISRSREVATKIYDAGICNCDRSCRILNSD